MHDTRDRDAATDRVRDLTEQGAQHVLDVLARTVPLSVLAAIDSCPPAWTERSARGEIPLFNIGPAQ